MGWLHSGKVACWRREGKTCIAGRREMIHVRDRVDKVCNGTGFPYNRVRLDNLILWEEFPYRVKRGKKWEKACPKLIEEGSESCSSSDRHNTTTRHNGFGITAHHHRYASTQETNWCMKVQPISKEWDQTQQSEQKSPCKLEVLEEMGKYSNFRIFLNCIWT